MKRLTAIALFAALAFNADAADIKTSKGNVNVTFFSPDIVRVFKTSDELSSQEGKAGRLPSLVVTMKPQQVKVSEKEVGGKVVLASGKLTVCVDKSSGRVTFSHDGKQLLQEGDWHLTPITDGLDKGCVKVKSNFRLDNDEKIYGIGLMENYKMNQRGENRRMMQSNLEDFQNVFQSIKGYILSFGTIILRHSSMTLPKTG